MVCKRGSLELMKSATPISSSLMNDYVDSQLFPAGNRVPRASNAYPQLARLEAATITISIERRAISGRRALSVVLMAIDDWKDENSRQTRRQSHGGRRGAETADNVLTGGGIGGMATVYLL